MPGHDEVAVGVHRHGGILLVAREERVGQELIALSDAIGGEGHMLMGEGIGAMSVTIEKEAKTLDQAKSDADMYSPKNLKEEKLADGWALTFENTGSMGKNYFVEVRRDIDGKSYSCSTTSPDERAQKVLAACKTLRK